MVIPCSEHQYQAICEYQNTNIIPEDSYVHNMINCGLFTNHGQFCDSSACADGFCPTIADMKCPSAADNIVHSIA
jgi:hypothetical protein